jgi:hypothetical protein
VEVGARPLPNGVGQKAGSGRDDYRQLGERKTKPAIYKLKKKKFSKLSLYDSIAGQNKDPTRPEAEKRFQESRNISGVQWLMVVQEWVPLLIGRTGADDHDLDIWKKGGYHKNIFLPLEKKQT